MGLNNISADEEANISLAAKWADWAANPTNWGQLIFGSQKWMTFQEVMDYIHQQMDDNMMSSGTKWMQKLSGQEEDDFPFAEWEMVSFS